VQQQQDSVHILYDMCAMCILYRVHRDRSSSATAAVGGYSSHGSGFMSWTEEHDTRTTNEDDDYDEDAAGRYSFFIPAPPLMTGLQP